MIPQRIQFKRGVKLPQNTKYVGRPTKWGNPFKLVADMIYVDAGYRRKILDKWVYMCQGNIQDVIDLYENVIKGQYRYSNNIDVIFWKKHFQNLDLSELKGYDLACWCKPGSLCHADILLKLANMEAK
jgi:hypothetical protein